MQNFRRKRVTLAGLGKFGGNLAAARWLVEQGASVLLTDKDPAEAFIEQRRQIADLPIQYRLGEHRVDDFTQTDIVVASPAIPPANEYLVAARQAGVPITTEIRLFVERCPATICGVTGTKGKSTAAALLQRMLATRFTTWLGGNIGVSLLGELSRISKTDIVVLELSSFMLHYLREMGWSPHIAVITMLASDHVNWHGSVEEYRAAKRAILEHQRPDDYAVLNMDCPLSAELARATRAHIVGFGQHAEDDFPLAIPGPHNQLNARAAFAAASILGVTRQQAQSAIADFRGLDHRLQLVAETSGIRFYNDSIATIPEAAVAALHSFPAKKVIQIVGGSDHHLPITAMCAALVEHAKAVLCIGQTGPRIVECMSEAKYNAAAPAYLCGDLATAMKIAEQIATAGDIVLLSTGFKSYDQFGNFQDRGNAFVEMAKAIATRP